MNDQAKPKQKRQMVEIRPDLHERLLRIKACTGASIRRIVENAIAAIDEDPNARPTPADLALENRPATSTETAADLGRRFYAAMLREAIASMVESGTIQTAR